MSETPEDVDPSTLRQIDRIRSKARKAGYEKGEKEGEFKRETPLTDTFQTMVEMRDRAIAQTVREIVEELREIYREWHEATREKMVEDLREAGVEVTTDPTPFPPAGPNAIAEKSHELKRVLDRLERGNGDAVVRKRLRGEWWGETDA